MRRKIAVSEGEHDHVLVTGECGVIDFGLKVADRQHRSLPLHIAYHLHPLFAVHFGKDLFGQDRQDKSHCGTTAIDILSIMFILSNVQGINFDAGRIVQPLGMLCAATLFPLWMTSSRRRTRAAVCSADVMNSTITIQCLHCRPDQARRTLGSLSMYTRSPIAGAASLRYQVNLRIALNETAEAVEIEFPGTKTNTNRSLSSSWIVYEAVLRSPHVRTGRLLEFIVLSPK